MAELRGTVRDILARGRADSDELEALRRQVYAGDKVGRPTADSLAELHKRVRHLTPAFERFFYRAVKDHVLADGRISAGGAGWLRRLLLAGGPVTDEGRKLLHELRGEAAEVSPEFEALFAEAMRQPPEQRTCG